MLQWGAHLETGNEWIDDEHRAIYAHLNEIGLAIRGGVEPKVLRKLIVVLLDYTCQHFHHEEHAMACSNCPARETNCAAHRAFIARLHNWLAVVSSGTVPVSLVSDIHAESCAWIERHIQKVDSALRPASSPPRATATWESKPAPQTSSLSTLEP